MFWMPEVSRKLRNYQFHSFRGKFQVKKYFRACQKYFSFPLQEYFSILKPSHFSGKLIV
jgi:hypothetical protein